MKSSAYKTALTIALISGAFALFIAINLTANHLRIKSADPLNSVALEELRKDLKTQPTNEPLKEEIRNLDLIIRKAYFTSLSFTNAGAWLLLASIIILLASLKIMSKISEKLPHPAKFEDKDDSLEYASQARESLIAALVIMAIVVGFSGLISKSPLTSEKNQLTVGEKQITHQQDKIHLNWPAFRGPNGVGIAHYTNAPTSWNGKTGENILWKKPVPRLGFSSPIVWENKVFLTCADEKAREVLCYDGNTGELLWQKEVGVVPGMPAELPEVMEDTTYAASTPATDGHSVFAVFGTGNIVCFDFEGNKKWARHLANVENIYGHASSLITYKNLVFAQFDDDTIGRVFALDAQTGKTVWLAERELEPCWSSPIIAETKTGPQLIVPGHPLLMSYEPETGKKLWEFKCLGGELATSPAFANETIFTGIEYESLTAIKLSDTTKAAWQSFDELPDVASPLAFGEYLVIATGSGTLNFYNSVTSKILWTKEFDEGFYSSPIIAGSNIYLMDKKGVTFIFKAGDKYNQIAKAELGEEATCIPAIMDGKIYIRGKKNLYCIGTK